MTNAGFMILRRIFAVGAASVLCRLEQLCVYIGIILQLLHQTTSWWSLHATVMSFFQLKLSGSRPSQSRQMFNGSFSFS